MTDKNQEMYLWIVLSNSVVWIIYRQVPTTAISLKSTQTDLPQFSTFSPIQPYLKYSKLNMLWEEAVFSCPICNHYCKRKVRQQTDELTLSPGGRNRIACKSTTSLQTFELFFSSSCYPLHILSYKTCLPYDIYWHCNITCNCLYT